MYVFLQVCKLRRVSHTHTHTHIHSHSNFKKAVGLFLNACKNNKQCEHSESPDDCMRVYMYVCMNVAHTHPHCTVRIFVINVFYYCKYVCMLYTYMYVCVHCVTDCTSCAFQPHTCYSSLTKSCLPRLSLHLHTAALLTDAMSVSMYSGCECVSF